jgi:hypothetical protein
MKKYCLDTSGLSNLLSIIPEDIYPTLWSAIGVFVQSGAFAVTTEIYDELTHLPGNIGSCVSACKSDLVLEVGDPGWDWKGYIGHSNRLQDVHKDFISEFNEDRASTVGLNDISIISLACCLKLPLISMEVSAAASTVKRRIPDVCKIENVPHLTFNEFLRMEGIAV